METQTAAEAFVVALQQIRALTLADNPQKDRWVKIINNLTSLETPDLSGTTLKTNRMTEYVRTAQILALGR